MTKSAFSTNEIGFSEHAAFLCFDENELPAYLQKLLKDKRDQNVRVFIPEDKKGALGVPVCGSGGVRSTNFPNCEFYSPAKIFNPRHTPQEMVDVLARELERTQQEGFAGAVWCRDAFPIESSTGGGQMFFEQERRLNTWLADKKCSVFCFNYNREMDSSFLLELFNVHPAIVYNKMLYKNVYFLREKAEVFQDSASVLNNRIQNLISHSCLMSERRKLDALLHEKEFLLREVHHRVINNLQIVNSLLDLQTIQSRNQECSQILAEARSKIYSIALIHTQLYQSERFDRIDMVCYIKDLALYLLHVFSSPERRIIPQYNLDDFFLPVTQAIPFAIIITELLSNSLKHAFPERSEGEIILSAKVVGGRNIQFELQDNGVGFSTTCEKRAGVGINIVQNIARTQLKGNISFVRDKGTLARLEFPVQ